LLFSFWITRSCSARTYSSKLFSCYFLLDYAQRCQVLARPRPGQGGLLFSFELCWKICPVKWKNTSVSLVLLFSFELCEDMYLYDQPAVMLDLLFSFELCLLDAILFFSCPRVPSLLFSFELCQGSQPSSFFHSLSSRNLLFSFELC